MCVECGTVFRILIKGKVYSERKTCSDECAEIQRRDHIDYASPERSRKLSKAHKRLGSIANLHTPEVRAKAGPAIGDAKAWVYRTGKSALGVPRSSRVIYLMSPHGEVFRTQVIRQFVRDHEELFSAADLARRKANKKNRTTIEGNMTCKAMNGLGEVAREVKRSWKGWTKVKETE
jgi:hypothetical protein